MKSLIKPNTIHCCDCMDGLREMPDNYVDLAIVDPPYGIAYNNTKLGRNSKNEFEDIKGDDKPPTIELLNEWMRVSKVVIVWGALNFLSILPYKGVWVCWDKRTKIEADKVFGSAFELAWTSKETGYDKICRIMHGGVINADGPNTPRIHPTQKPVALYKWLLQNYAKEGDLILDTHMGSGSSYIACLDMGFDYIGYEIDADYFTAIEQRVYDFTRQTNLFEV